MDTQDKPDDAKKARASWAARKVAKDLMMEGIWAPIPIQGLGTFRLKIRARDTTKYAEIMQRIYKPIRARYKDSIPAELQEQLLLQIMAEACIAGWEDVPDNNGNPLPYSQANAVLLLETFPDLRDAVAAVSGEYALYLAQAEEDVLGN